MRALPAVLGWSIAAATSLLLSWFNGRSAPEWVDAAPPPALPRPVSAEEGARVDAQAQAMTATLQAQSPLPELDQVEGVLAGGLPDNPLMEGISTLVEACPDDPQGQRAPPAADWIYCPRTGVLRGGLPTNRPPR